MDPLTATVVVFFLLAVAYVIVRRKTHLFTEEEYVLPPDPVVTERDEWVNSFSLLE